MERGHRLAAATFNHIFHFLLIVFFRRSSGADRSWTVDMDWLQSHAATFNCIFHCLLIVFSRESSGADRSWTVGTELLQPYLYDEEVSTPEALRKTLFDDAKRAQFVASTEHGGTESENGG